MLFNSTEFLIFFGVVFSIYWLLPHKWQNRFLLAGSYFFYGSWNWKFLSLLIISTVIDYFCGILIHKSTEEKRRKIFLMLGLFASLGMLGFFKYANFFIAEAAGLLSLFGLKENISTLKIILPIGISFYTFQSMSYYIDVYRKKLKPERNFLDYALYIAFFPQLIAGPIERATHLLPQIKNKRTFEYNSAVSGLRLAAWGMFKKVIIADRVAVVADTVFNNAHDYTGIPLIIATFFFAVQIYCDFSGYSDIARGVARTFGFNLIVNFNLPYYSKNPVEFWQRWHISLSSWFQDYLYFPLAMHYMRKTKGVFNKYKAHLYAMALIGLWHGANWTFLLFGAYWGLVIIGYIKIKEYLNINSKKIKSPLVKILFLENNSYVNMVNMAMMFCVVCVGWIFFRANNLSDAIYILTHAFTGTWTSMYNVIFQSGNIQNEFLGKGLGIPVSGIITCLLLIGFIEIVHFAQSKVDIEKLFASKPIVVRWAVYYASILMMIYFAPDTGKQFIYFQF
jgi:D-alanyl-lipoteichoic acid acyltransferase DltB (MBOAT superfamily)